MKRILLLTTFLFLAHITFAQCVAGDCINGKGQFKYENGDVYTGTFSKGKRHGKGILRFANGAKFTGEFKYDMPNGRGILDYRNTAKYLGFFKDGKRSGHGVIYNQEGEVQRCGIWEKGKLVSKTEERIVLRKLGLKPSNNSNDPYNGSYLKITNTGVVVANDDDPAKPEPKPNVTTTVNNDRPKPIDPPKPVEAFPKPVITIVSPANATTRGFKVVSSKPVNVTPKEHMQEITGSVEAKAGLKELRVNGRAVSVTGGGSFTATVKLFPGKNEVYLTATDLKNQTGEKILVLEAKGEVVDPVVNNKPKKLPKKVTNQKRLALLIGNSNYEGGGTLKNPVNDVRAMEAKLKTLGFDVMKYEDLDQRGMKKAIDNFGNELQKYDVGMFFYAGHGLQVNGTNYLVPLTANIENEQDAEYECIQTGRVLAKMEAAKTKVNVIILDACRNNPFERSWTRSSGGKGLAFINAPMGSFIAYATAPGTTASDGSGANGLYTENLLRYIETPDITIEELFRTVRHSVVQASNKAQVPWDSSSLTGEFYFK